MWKKDLRVIVEATTYCNAKCPQCSRTNSRDEATGLQGLGTPDWLPLNSWSFKEFKQMFNDETLSVLKSVQFSGTYGDPGMTPDLFEMVKYLREKDVRVSVNTNGSMRDENFWFKMAAYCNTITFDVDGNTQEMHAKYRRNTVLKKTLANMQAAIDMTGGENIKVFTVVFKHNENYVKDIKKMVMDMGILEENYFAMESGRFRDGATFDFINEQGEVESLEQTTDQSVSRDRSATTRKVRDHKDLTNVEARTEILCAAEKNNKLHITNTGLVFPCCYLAAPVQRVRYGTTAGAPSDPILKYIIDNPFLFSLKYHTLPEIISNEWYTKQLGESFTRKPSFYCKKMCGTCK